MINRKDAPKTYPIEKIKFNAPNVEQLNCGSLLYVFQESQLNLLHISIEVAAGQIYESQKYISQMLFPFLREASSQYDKEEMDQLLDYYGSSWNTVVALQNVMIELVIPKRNFAKIFPIIANALCNPDFKAHYLKDYKERRMMNFEYNIQKNSYRASHLMLKTLFKADTPVGTPLEKCYIESITTEDLKKYYDEVFQASRITFYASGNFGKTEFDILNREFSQLSLGNMDFNPVSVPQVSHTKQYLFEPRIESLQSSIILCKNMFGYNHEERACFSVLNTILGGYFGSRLQQRVREKCGYTYGIFSSSTYVRDYSLFCVESDVIAEKTDDAIEACFEEILRLQTELVEWEELEKVRTYLLGNCLRAADGITTRMKTYIRWHKFGLDEKEMEKTFEVIKEITPQTILTLAQHYLSRDSFSTIIVGHSKRDEKNC